MNQTPERKLAAIMFTDIVGYTDLMGKNESDSIKYMYYFIGVKFEEIAFIYWLMDEKDKAYKKALDIIEKQLVGPSGTNWWDIKYNNLFNKVFGNNSRFISMIKKDEDKFRRESTYDLNIFMP